MQPARATADDGGIVDLLLGMRATAAAFGRVLATLAAGRVEDDAVGIVRAVDARFVDVLLGLAALAERVVPLCAVSGDDEREAPPASVAPPSPAELLR